MTDLANPTKLAKLTKPTKHINYPYNAKNKDNNLQNVLDSERININKNTDPIQFIDNVHTKLLKSIEIISDNKKSYIYKFILNCYETMNELEIIIDKEKLALESLLEEKIQKEKVIYSYEKQNVQNSKHINT